MSNNLKLQVVLSAVDKLTAPFRSAQESNKRLASAVRQSRDSLKTLNQQASQIDGFRKIKQQLTSTQQAYQSATQRVATLAKEIANSENPTKKQLEAFKKAQREAGQLKTKYEQLQQSVQRQRSALQANGISTNQLGQAQRRLNGDIERTTQQLRRQENQLRRSAEQERRMVAAKSQYQKTLDVRNKMAGTGATMTATGAGMLYSAKQTLMPGYEFNVGMSKVQALTRLDKNSDEFKMLREQARELGATTAFTANQVAQGQAFYAMAGFKPEQIKNAMPGTLAMSLAGDIDLGTTADIGSNILTGFKLDSDQMGRVSDVLVGAFTRSNTSLTMLGDTMKYVAPVASGLGVDLETAAAATGKLGDAGIQGSMAGTSLRAILGRLAEPPKMAAKALEELGIKTRDAKGNLRDFPELLAELDKKTAKMGNAQRAGFFKHIAGEEAFSALSVLAEQAGKGELQTLVADLKQAKGEAQKVAGTMTDNLSGDMKNLQSAWEDLGIQIFDGIDSPLRQISQSITRVISKVGVWMKENPELAKTLTMIGLAIAGIITTLGILSLSIAAMLGPLAAAKLSLSILGIKGGNALTLLLKPIKLLGSAFLGLGKAILANPILLVIAAIAAAVYLIYKNWDTIGPYVYKVWDTVKKYTAIAWQALKDTIKSAWEAIKYIFFNWTPLGLIIKHWDSIVSYTQTTWTMIKTKISDVWEGIKTTLKNGWNNIVKSVQETWETIKTTISTKWNEIVEDTKALPAKFLQFGSDLIDAIIQGIKNKWTDFKNSIGELATAAKEALTPEFMKSNDPKMQSALDSYNSNFAGMYDSGGYIPRGKFGIAGENGPEIVEGPANITSRKHTAMLAAAALSLGSAFSLQAQNAPLHPHSLPVENYRPAPANVNIQQQRYQGAPAHYEINIHPQPNQSAQDIAQLVIAEIERREREKQARLNSRYQDSEVW
ncbi:TPA: phage tail tape measure protein [Proteus mirabilis]|uniref:Phage tail fiber protein (Tape measure protein) n=1 Tax=Proteus mirabilis (strain HI4320) TaxID=529507 RepID=B4F0J1_PROMH|nr:phage tail tape measure protein [Proteus mirabilis]EKT8673900.1 phage tail tape measure protein [Proteus mirabilis]MBG3075906.1 phage tail tape measure protein [Proteus mirabilis]MBI6383601.1 phage tail tape measure protein [Proteus mirabilis]CAR44018.1 putative phage tail fiber protein (tape measure protein) [Proteus mirabilis HI4320]HEI8403824.1 phage tail tape measure protein [Proteus mirabilis]